MSKTTLILESRLFATAILSTIDHMGGLATLRSLGQRFPLVETHILIEGLDDLRKAGRIIELIGPKSKLYWASTAWLEEIS